MKTNLLRLAKVQRRDGIIIARYWDVPGAGRVTWCAAGWSGWCRDAATLCWPAEDPRDHGQIVTRGVRLDTKWRVAAQCVRDAVAGGGPQMVQ
jgi:hypothetical protein